MRNIFIFGLFLILLATFFYMPLQGDLTGYAIVKGTVMPVLSFEISSVQSFYKGSPSCYSKAEGILYNNGFSDANNVTIKCQVLNEKLTLLGDSKYDIDIIEKRSSKPFSLTIDTECTSAMAGQKYQCDVDCDNCG